MKKKQTKQNKSRSLTEVISSRYSAANHKDTARFCQAGGVTCTYTRGEALFVDLGIFLGICGNWQCHDFLIGHRSVAKKVWIAGADPDRVSAAESSSYSPEKLALNLLTAIYTFAELSSGNCTQPKKKKDSATGSKETEKH